MQQARSRCCQSSHGIRASYCYLRGSPVTANRQQTKIAARTLSAIQLPSKLIFGSWSYRAARAAADRTPLRILRQIVETIQADVAATLLGSAVAHRNHDKGSSLKYG